MEEIIISFIVPSFNRLKMTRMMVKSILDYHGNDIEVVVVDNASEDSTVSDLKSIKDDRLVIIENEENLGGPGNMLHSMKFGRGKYLFVAFSRETIIAEKIPNLVEFLRNLSFPFVYCLNDTEINKKLEIYNPGKKVIKKFGYASLHPTGMIFNNEKLNSIIKNIDPKDAKEKYLYLPHDFWVMEFILDGSIAIYGEKVRRRVENDYLKKTVSDNVTASEDVWFFPKGRILQLNKYINHLSSLDMSAVNKGKILMWIYGKQLKLCTITYLDLRSDEITCSHYSTKSKKVTLGELLQAAQDLRNAIFELNDIKGFRMPYIFRARLYLSKAETVKLYIVHLLRHMIRRMLK